MERDMVIADCPPSWNTDNVGVENPFFQEVDMSVQHLQSFTEDIQKAHPDGTVLVVTHATWIYNWLLLFKNISRRKLDNCEFIVVTL
jgi:broad specificity phosphatase PhoE